MEKLKNVKWISIITVILLLWIIGTFYDLQISQYATSHASQIVIWLGDKIGSLAPIVVAGAGCACLYKKDTYHVNILRWLWLSVMVILSVYGGYLLVKPNIEGIINKVILLVWSCVSFAGFYHFQSQLPQDDEKLRKIGYTLLLDVVLVMVCVNILKVLWGRERFVFMVNSATDYTPWYILHPLRIDGDIYKSFPSAHTAASSTLLPFYLALSLRIKSHDYAKQIQWISWILIVFVMITRIYAGMHFLTDVLTGMMIGYGIYKLSKYLINKYV